MKIIYFVRHGQTNNNILANEGTFNNNEPLNNTGISQSINAAECLSKITNNIPSIILTSPLLRTQQTALTISKRLMVPVMISGDLMEFNPGKSSENKIVDVLNLYKNVPQNELPNFRLKDGESWFDISKRTTRVVEEYIKSHHKSIIIVSHASIMQICINSLLEIEPSKWLELNDISNGTQIRVGYKRGKYFILN